MISVLYCCDPLNPRRVDEHFAREASAVRSAGARVALLDHDALGAGHADLAVERVPADVGPLWYRGWMISGRAYDALDAALLERGARLLTTPAMYRTAHELPGWYAAFADLTPASAWTPSAPFEVPDTATLTGLVAQLRAGPGIVKDFVKSRKHEWAQACYVPDLKDADALGRVVTRLVELQGEDLAGGIVARSFESFGDEGEARVWWLDGQAVLVSPHPDTPALAPRPDVGPVRDAVTSLGCRFVTTDLARRADGQWRVVEVGDGQVSDLAVTADLDPLLDALVGAAP